MVNLAIELNAEIIPMAIVLVIALGIVFLYLFVFPLIVATALKFSGSPDVVEFLPEETPPPRQVANYFSQANKELLQIGFERLSACVLPSPLDNVTAVTTMYVNSTTTDAVMVAAIWGRAGDAEVIQTKFVEFMSEFSHSNIRVIETSNIVDVDPFKIPEDDLRFRFPSLVQTASIPALYQFHQAIVEDRAPGQKKFLRVCNEFRSDVPTYLKERVLKKSYDRQVEFGLIKYNVNRDQYVPTFLGTYRMVWKLLPPFVGFIKAAERRREKKLRQKYSNEFM